MKPERVTIKTVAEACGVSISTVSRALNGKTPNTELVARITKKASELGYTPSGLAKSFKRQQLNQVLFAVEDIGNPAYIAMVRAIEPVLRDGGLRLLLHSTGGEVDQEIALVQSLSEGLLDGLIISPIRVTSDLVQALENAAKPVSVIGTLPEAAATVDNVRVDSSKGARMAVKHLIDKGCRRIAFFNGPTDTTPGASRLSGYRAQLETAGVDFDSELMTSATGFNFEAGERAASMLPGHDFDGLLASSDALAVAAIHELRRRGRRPGKDVRIVGMDDAEMARLSIPPLTSVNLGAAERGALAAQLLVQRIASPDTPPKTKKIAPRLVVRESSS